ncbi:MAG: MerC domain-containing protein [Bernardetiaceae bacterium]
MWYKNLDFWGMSASLLCAVHCAALPVLVTFSVAGNWALWSDVRLEALFLSGSGLLAIFSLIPGYRQHHYGLALGVAVGGFLLLLLGHLPDLLHGHGGHGHAHHPSEAQSWVSAVGGLCLASAHWINWRWMRHQRGCSLK